MEILHTGLHTILDKLVERICLKIKAYCWGNFFFPLFFIFSLTCYSVFFFFSLSSILLITPLCYVLYVNFVIVCYLAFFLPVYVSISVTALVEADFFPRRPWPPTLSSSAFGKQLRFHRFSLISFCSRLKVVFLYCNYYFFALSRNLLLWIVNDKNICDRERVVFWNWPLPVDKFPWSDRFINYHNLFTWLYTDVVWGKLMLITPGT